jgi:Cytochrome c, mono- and diheme variants
MSAWIAAATVAVVAVTVGASAAYGTDAYVPTPAPAPGSYAAMPKPDTTGMNAQQVAQVQRGEYLTTAADCMPCHMAPGAKPFAGGLSFETPFGVLYSPNISSSKSDGIGNWTDKQFWNALHNGIAPGSSLAVFPHYLYPAMPYTSYTKLSKPDVLAIKAYLEAIPAVNTPNVKNDMKFPFNIRAMQLGWRIMFFRAGPLHMKKTWSPAVRNGAYIAEALGHCSECHSPRNLLFAIKSGQTLAGAPILGEPWYAPNISASKQYGVGDWSQSELVSFLHDGGNMQKGSAYGPMKAVVDYSLSQIPKSDVKDLVAYLQTATPPRETPMKKVTVPASELAAGKTLYVQNCAACHQADGKGVADVFPNLAGNQSVWDGPANNTIGIVLGGMIPWHANGPAMPAFGAILDDHQIAQIANYVRTAWGESGYAGCHRRPGLRVPQIRAAAQGRRGRWRLPRSLADRLGAGAQARMPVADRSADRPDRSRHENHAGRDREGSRHPDRQADRGGEKIEPASERRANEAVPADHLLPGRRDRSVDLGQKDGAQAVHGAIAGADDGSAPGKIGRLT